MFLCTLVLSVDEDNAICGCPSVSIVRVVCSNVSTGRIVIRANADVRIWSTAIVLIVSNNANPYLLLGLSAAVKSLSIAVSLQGGVSD